MGNKGMNRSFEGDEDGENARQTETGSERGKKRKKRNRREKRERSDGRNASDVRLIQMSR